MRGWLLQPTPSSYVSLSSCRMTLLSHHDLLLENLLSSCKVLYINTPRKQKQPKETNWKQKFQKLQNENICLTKLNMENKRNFPFCHLKRSLRGQKKMVSKV